MPAYALALLCGFAPAQEGDKPGEKQAALPAHWQIPPAPVLSPDEERRTFQLADDFLTIELFASEPMVQDPVALDFDAEGRAWVVEMRGFMPDIDGRGENEPIGSISILTDTNHDGRADKATVFLDKLVLPRAIKVCWGGALVASDEKLWFARDTNGDDTADVKELIDDNYIRSGNIEHQPNGLLLALDNWIYSANSDLRYRRTGGGWLKEKTEYRGQWGLTQDASGRLFYNVNFSQLHGDPFPPNYSLRNPHFTPIHGINQQITTNQSIFTLRPNTGINRAYRPGVLDGRGHLREFTSASAPLVDRGGRLFGNRPESPLTSKTGDAQPHVPAELNLFVCESAANLVKRNLVREDGLLMVSRFAYPDREFLAATDERFRPVNIHNAPDGSLYIVDMYRGISQHKEFMTSHLRKETLARGLDKGIHLGRIWRVHNRYHEGWPVRSLASLSTPELLAELRHPNGWMRDTAQRLIVERGEATAIPELLNLMDGTDVRAALHALWAVEGLLAEIPLARGLASIMAYPTGTSENWRRLLAFAACDRPVIARHGLRLAELLAVGDPERERELIERIQTRLGQSDPAWRLQAALTLGSLAVPETVPALARAMIENASDPVIRDAVCSAKPGRELQLLSRLLDSPAFKATNDGREPALLNLASIIVRQRDPKEVATVLTMINQQSGDTAWRRLPLLNGFSENATALRRNPLVLDQEPGILSTLTEAPDPLVQSALSAIRSGIEWPGHPLPRPTAPTLRALTRGAALHFEKGRAVYRTACAACHGIDGNGLPNFGPPLVDSEWLKGPVQRIALIVLHGLEGPIEVNGRAYAPPIILPNMPAAPTLSDGEIAAVASFVRREFGQRSEVIYGDAITYLRAEHAHHETPWTPDELLKLPLPDIAPKPEKETP